LLAIAYDRVKGGLDSRMVGWGVKAFEKLLIRPTYPGFSVEVRDVEQPPAAFFEEKAAHVVVAKLASRKSGQRGCEHGAPVQSGVSGRDVVEDKILLS
jgi:hypothetical protein